jgi:solute carrier family 6 GABA transporter-like protein 1
VVTYYVPLLAWVMKYFARSFRSPLPWAGQDLSEYFSNVIIANTPAASTGSFNPDGSVASYSSYTGTGMLGETAGWAIFTWFVTWLCVFRGIGMTGRVIYVTMGLPFVLIIILLVVEFRYPTLDRVSSCTLPRGERAHFRVLRSGKALLARSSSLSV